MGPPVAKSAVNTPPKNPKGAAHHLLIGLWVSRFLCHKIRIPLATAKQPRMSSNGSLGASINKTIPSNIPTKLNGKSHFNSLKLTSPEDFLPTYKDAQISIITIMGTTVFSGYIRTNNGTETIEDPNPVMPKIK